MAGYSVLIPSHHDGARGKPVLRTQVQFTDEQHRRLRAFARREGVSIAEAVRRSVVRYLDEQAIDRTDLYQRAAEMVGGLEDESGATDLARGHDEYLGEAFD